MARPRTSVPEHDELVELGKDLVEWATEKTKELRCRYCQWYSGKHGFLAKQWDHMLEKPEFRGYYEQAQLALAQRFLDGSVNPSIAHRFLRIYCPDVKLDENELEAYKASLRKEEESKAPQKIVFEVNYKNDGNNSVEISPQIIPITDSPSA